MLLGSLLFYAYGEPKFVILLIASMFINYWLARGMNYKDEKETNVLRKVCLWTGLILNLSLLMIFKIAPAELGLPLGISFYTFQSLSYLLDVYRKEIKEERSILCLGTYICMFPQLVAGPIVAYDEVREQLKRPVVSTKDFDDGLKDFTVGLFLKVLMADRLSIFWNELAGIGYESVPVPILWLGSISYSLQIYFDFFGYSMMAIGLGKMLGFQLPKNFDLPYMATSIRDFYRKWHITLGRWFSKYVYIPLGGSRTGLRKTMINLSIVWILTSLWHGVSINFILWGALLCIVIILEKVFSERKTAKAGSKAENEQNERKRNAAFIMGNILKHAYVLFVIVLSWTCFAITDMSLLTTYIGRLFGFIHGINVSHEVVGSILHKYGITLLIGIFLCTKPAHALYKKLKDSWVGTIALVVLFWLSVYYVHMMGNNPFLYFRF